MSHSVEWHVAGQSGTCLPVHLPAMGAASSTPALTESLARVTGAQGIAPDDPFWESLLTTNVPVSRADDLATASFAACSELVGNNLQSGNFQSLVLKTIELLERAVDPHAGAAQLHQCCGAVFLVRLFLKHMLETLEPEDIVLHLQPPGGARADLPLPQALIALLGALELNANSYHLHMEAMALLVVCMSAQLFTELSTAVPQPLVVATLSADGPSAERLVERMLRHYIDKPQPPAESVGLLSSLSAAAGYVLYLPWTVFSYFFRGSDAPALQLGDRAVQVVLLLTQHLPPALFPDPDQENPFSLALAAVSDERGADARADPEQGRSELVQVSFRRLHDTIGAAIPQESAVLLLYLLLHGNREFLDHCLSRADPDTLLLPLARTLYDIRSLRANQLYMLLIAILMLSQDEGFIAARPRDSSPTPRRSALWPASHAPAVALAGRARGGAAVGAVVQGAHPAQVLARRAARRAARAHRAVQPRHDARRVRADQLPGGAREHGAVVQEAPPARGALPRLAVRRARAQVPQAQPAAARRARAAQRIARGARRGGARAASRTSRPRATWPRPFASLRLCSSPTARVALAGGERGADRGG